MSKVVAACDGLDDTACAAVDDVLVERVVGMDPARVTTLARKVATRIAADQVAAAAAKNRKDRCVQVTPGPDGTTDWWARLPAGRSAAAWAAIRDLGEEYAGKDPALSLDQARADAFMDLLLTNVTVTTKLTLGIPVITGPDADHARDTAVAEHQAESPATVRPGPPARPTPTPRTPTTAEDADDRSAGRPRWAGDTRRPTGRRPTAVADGGRPTSRPVQARRASGRRSPPAGSAWAGSSPCPRRLISGCEVPGIGFIDADTVEALLTMVPTDIGRALLDARTGTLMESVSTAYRPPKAVTDFVTTRDGSCRMWGCNRPATSCDLDHARPWPNGPTTPTNLAGLCRRHHRLKQRRRWGYHLTPDGTATWTSPSGTTRTTLPDHAALPPPPPPALPARHDTAARAVAVEPPPF